jgi:hypothetical protein
MVRKFLVLTGRGDFVRDNYLYYSRLLYEFLKILKKMDIYSCISVRPGLTQRNRTSQRKILELIGKVLSIFSEAKLLKHLQVIETALDSLENYSGTTSEPRTSTHGIASARADSARPVVVTPSKSSFRTTVGTPNGMSGTGLGALEHGYANCGPVVRAQVVFFEGKSEYVPVFLSVDVPRPGIETVYDLVF